MKKIILAVTNDLSYDQRMHRICGSLARAGYRVELVGRQLPWSKPPAERPYRQTRLACRLTEGKGFYLEYNLRLLFYLLTSRFDAVCAVDLDTIVPAWIAGRLKGAFLVYDAHEYFSEVPEVVGRPRPHHLLCQTSGPGWAGDCRRWSSCQSGPGLAPIPPSSSSFPRPAAWA